MQPSRIYIEMPDFFVVGAGQAKQKTRMCKYCQKQVARYQCNWPFHLAEVHPEILKQFQFEERSILVDNNEALDRILVKKAKASDKGDLVTQNLLSKFIWTDVRFADLPNYRKKKKDSRRGGQLPTRQLQRTKGRE
jgi:hypothetical protein